MQETAVGPVGSMRWVVWDDDGDWLEYMGLPSSSIPCLASDASFHLAAADHPMQWLARLAAEVGLALALPPTARGHPGSAAHFHLRSQCPSLCGASCLAIASRSILCAAVWHLRSRHARDPTSLPWGADCQCVSSLLGLFNRRPLLIYSLMQLGCNIDHLEDPTQMSP